MKETAVICGKVAWGEIGKDPIHQAKGFGHFSLEESQSS
jgi:hypothetical protein